MTEKYRSKPIIVDLVKLTVAYATGELFDYYLIGTWVRKIHFKDSERSLFFWHNNNPCTCRHNVANLLLVSLLCHFNRPLIVSQARWWLALSSTDMMKPATTKG
jgi:hypothetical protein